MNKTVYVLVAAAIVAGVWFFVGRDKPVSDTSIETTQESDVQPDSSPEAGSVETTTQPQTIEIVYSDKGFNPAQVTIKVGDSIVFKNESSSTFWPASDPHPVHTALSEFDARAAVASGQTYTFTFNKAGTWGFHDHLNSGDKGSVIVQ